MQRIDNNFDLIRLIAAIFVLITHSYALSGAGEHDFLITVTKGAISFSHLGVAIFFIISGYLIVQSAENSPSWISFTWKRILRIIPGLAVVLILSVFVLGPLITTLDLNQYFNNSDSYKHLLTISIYNIEHLELPGVFVNNTHKAINGSLWTLAYEVTCYLIVLLSLVSKTLRYRYILLALWILVFIIRIFLNDRIFYYNYGSPYIGGLNIMYCFEWFFYFITGSLLYKFRELIPVKFYVFTLCIIVLSGSVFLFNTSIIRILLYPTIAYCIYYLSFCKTKVSLITKYGDYSYGMYIYAFPIQQLIISLHPEIPVAVFAIISIICTLPFAIFSWHFIEKKALQFKNII